MSSWRPALRIARRTVLRSPGRSLLIALLVALPVCAGTVIDVLARTYTGPDKDAQRQIGFADATVSVPAGASERVRRQLPAGSRIAPKPFDTRVVVRRGQDRLRVDVTIADAREPLHRYEAQLVGGTAPDRAGEVLVSQSLAKKLDLLRDDAHLRPEATITLSGGQTVVATGLVEPQFCLSCERMVAVPGSTVANAAAKRRNGFSEKSLDQLVDLPGDTPPVGLETRLDDQGFDFSPRKDFRSGQGTTDLNVSAATLQGAALVAIIVGLGLLEVVLLAGTAFAVGARRQMREIGLAAANGASPRDVKRIVLAQGLVLGGLGAVIGIVAGAAIAVAARPLWEHYMDEAVGRWAYGTWEIMGAALLGLFSGLAAAIVPARGAARMRPVDALAQRFRPVRSATRRSALIGAGLVGAGALSGLAGDRLLAGDFSRYQRSLEAVGTYGASVAKPSSTDAIMLIVGGATLAVVGLVLLAPTFIGWLARLGPRLPLSSRLAARDATRHSHRTGPATGAITVVVAGSLVIAFLLAATKRGDELSYVPSLPPNVLAVDYFGEEFDENEPVTAPTTGERGARREDRLNEKRVQTAAARAAAHLPGSQQLVIRTPYSYSTFNPHTLIEQAGSCPAPIRSEDGCNSVIGTGHIAVATTPGLADTVAAGKLDTAARSALAAGKVVVFDRVAVDKTGHVVIRTGSDADRVRLPAHFVQRGKPYGALDSALVSPALARARGWETKTETILVRYPPGTDTSAVDAALDVADPNSNVSAYVETPLDREDGGILEVVAIIAGLVTLFGVAISVALSAAEGRADLVTLAAVGAPPRQRRMLVAGQALVVGGLGCALGVLLAAFIAFTARASTGAPGLVIPWGNVLVTGLAVPLLAALVAGLCTRSRPPLVRRAE